MSEDEATAANALLESVRKTMVQVIVVNGLKDVKLGREFIAKTISIGISLCSILFGHGTAAESDQKRNFPAHQAEIPAPSLLIKQEVAEGRFESNPPSYHRDSFRSQ
mgnify:FL=1